jgi:multiple sugar transport system substrate-binding protein
MRYTKTSLVAIVAMAMVCTGCSSSPDGGDKTAEEGGTLTIANYQFLEPTRGEKIWDALTGYQDENPAVDMKKIEIPRADYVKAMSTQIGAGEGPDVFVLPNPEFANFASSGALAALDGVLSADQEKTLLSNNSGYEFDGKQYGYLWNATPYTLFWNKNLTEAAGVAPPTTFDELVGNVKAVKEKTGKTGFAVRASMAEGASSWWDDFPNFTYGFGGSFSDGTELTIDSPENIAGVAALKEIYKSGAFSVGDDASTYRSKFAAGQVGYVIDNAAAVVTMLSDQVTAADVGSSLLPFPGGSSVAAGTVIVINANSKNLDLAKDFIRWLFSEGAQVSLSEVLFPSAVGTSVPAPQSQIDENPWIAAFYEQLKDSKSVVIKGFEIETPQIANIILTQVERALTTDASAKEALNEAQKQAVTAVGSRK